MKQIEIARMGALQVKLTQSLINCRSRIIYLVNFLNLTSGQPWTYVQVVRQQNELGIPKRTTVSVEPWHICKHGFMFHGLFCENLTRNVPVFPIVHCWNQINLELMYINDFSMWLIPLIIYMKIPLRLYLDQYLAYLVSSNAMWISKRFSLTYVSLLVWVWLIRVIIQFRTRIRNHTHCFMWDVINQIFNGGSTRPPH